MRALAMGAMWLTLCACAPQIPVPTESHVAAAQEHFKDATLPQLKAGRHVYLRKCSRCHVNYSPARFSAEKWTREVEKMSSRARLRQGESEAILRYILTMRRAEVDQP